MAVDFFMPSKKYEIEADFSIYYHTSLEIVFVSNFTIVGDFFFMRHNDGGQKKKKWNKR